MVDVLNLISSIEKSTLHKSGTHLVERAGRLDRLRARRLERLERASRLDCRERARGLDRPLMFDEID